MGVRRGSFEKVRLQPQVWRQDAIAANIPMVDVTKPLEELARAKRAEGDAEAAKWKGISDMFEKSVGVIDKYIGIKKQQKLAVTDAKKEIMTYQMACASGEAEYQPDKALKMTEELKNKQATYDSFGWWSHEAEKVSEGEFNEKWAVTIKKAKEAQERIRREREKQERDSQGKESQEQKGGDQGKSEPVKQEPVKQTEAGAK